MKLALACVLAPALAFAEAPGIASHTPGKGTQLASGSWGQLDFSTYITLRYLNQRGVKDTFTDDIGLARDLDRRDDLQFQKVRLYFKGWFGVERFRYLTYVWSSNPRQGLGAQVIVAGNLTYEIYKAFVVGAGIEGLPSVRSMRGTFPYLLKQDSRTVADEYFRGSFTTGFWGKGAVGDHVHYMAMVGNNLSQFGVDAGQLDLGMQTFSVAIWANTNNFVDYFGDVEQTEQVAASVGLAGTHSREDRESQPGVEAPENSQIRVSDGRRIFDRGTVAPGVSIRRATYQMAALEAAIKYRGLALEGEAYARRLFDFDADGPLPTDDLVDLGYQLQASAMVLPHTLMLYGYHSRVFGDFGDPWDLGFGVNYYPFENRVMRANAEGIIVDRSPVGNLNSPLIVGADGFVFVANFEIFF